MIADGEVDAMCDEEARALDVAVYRVLVEDARWFVGSPISVHVGTAREQELGGVKMLVRDRPSERHVEYLLHRRRARTSVAMVTTEVAERRLALLVEPAL
jgi:hypothetical protein